MIYLELARQLRGWSQSDLGEHTKVRIHRSFISLIERGLGVPTDDQRKRLAGVLGIQPETLLDEVPDSVLRTKTEEPAPVAVPGTGVADESAHG